MRPIQLTAMAIGLLITSLSAYADIYKWVDENGKVHYSDKKPDSQSVESVDVRVNTMAGTEVKKVVMYSTAWCGYCRKAREHFKDKGIAFTEYDIEKDSAAKKRYDAFGGSGIPVIFVGDDRLNGFSSERFDRMFKGSGKKS